MHRHLPRVAALAVAAAALVSLAVTATAYTTTRLAPPKNPVIATVDLQLIVQGLDERGVKEQELLDEIKKLRTDLERREADVESLRQAIEVMPTATPENRAARSAEEARLRKMVYELDFNRQYNVALVDNLQGDLLRDLFGKIDDSIDQVAQQSGYTIVISNDSNVSIPRGGNDATQVAISRKRLLYVDPATDITNDVIAYMNNRFKAAGAR